VSDRLAKVDGEAPVTLGITPKSFADVARMARVLSGAQGFVPRDLLGNPNAIAAAIMTGMEIGIGPMQALRSVHVVDGRPTLSAELMLSLAMRAGVRPQWLESTAEVAHLRLTRPGYEAHEQRFSIAEAKQAGLAGKGNWQKYPAAMLRARALSAAMRAWCPDVIGSGVYVEGEIEPEEPREAPSVRVTSPTVAFYEDADVVDDDALEEAAPNPAKLSDCLDGGAIEGWLRTNGVAVLESGEAAIARVVEQATRIKLAEPEAWVAARVAELVRGTEAE
jgi:hypothetical protein